MIIKGGYIAGTNSMRSHPITDVLIKASTDWTRISIKVKNETITVGNTYTDVLICCRTDSDYNINLLVNGKKHFSQPTLYEFEITIDTENTDIVKLSTYMMYDG